MELLTATSSQLNDQVFNTAVSEFVLSALTWFLGPDYVVQNSYALLSVCSLERWTLAYGSNASLAFSQL